jgi:hypothetical protein
LFPTNDAVVPPNVLLWVRASGVNVTLRSSGQANVPFTTTFVQTEAQGPISVLDPGGLEAGSYTLTLSEGSTTTVAHLFHVSGEADTTPPGEPQLRHVEGGTSMSMCGNGPHMTVSFSSDVIVLLRTPQAAAGSTAPSGLDPGNVFDVAVALADAAEFAFGAPCGSWPAHDQHEGLQVEVAAIDAAGNLSDFGEPQPLEVSESNGGSSTCSVLGAHRAAGRGRSGAGHAFWLAGIVLALTVRAMSRRAGHRRNAVPSS